MYAVDPRGLLELRRFLEELWADALSRYALFAEGGIPRSPG